MTVSIRTFCRMALGAAGLALGAQAHAASVTVNAGAACTAFTWDQATSTLTCQVSTACVISGPTSAAPNTDITLSASCPTSTTITWGGNSCAGQTGVTCTANESTTGSRTYTVSGNNSAQDSHAVNWTTTTAAPSGCTLSANPTSGPSGSNVTLTANCSSGTNPIAISWGGASGTSGCPTSFNVGTPASCTVNNVTANATWTASFSGPGGNFANNPRSASFAVQTGGGGAFAGCPSGTVAIDGQWGNTAIDTAQWGDFGGNIVSVRLVPPANYTSTTIKTSSWAEYGAGPTVREAVFSSQPCDFSTANALKTSLGVAQRQVDVIGFYFKYKAGNTTTSAIGLVPGQSYYINIRNYNSAGQPTCTVGDCRMRGGIPQ